MEALERFGENDCFADCGPVLEGLEHHGVAGFCLDDFGGDRPGGDGDDFPDMLCETGGAGEDGAGKARAAVCALFDVFCEERQRMLADDEPERLIFRRNALVRGVRRPVYSRNLDECRKRA